MSTLRLIYGYYVDDALGVPGKPSLRFVDETDIQHPPIAYPDKDDILASQKDKFTTGYHAIIVPGKLSKKPNTKKKQKSWTSN